MTSFWDLLFTVGVERIFGPIMLAAVYYGVLWVMLFIFEMSEISDLLDMILAWKVIWWRLGVCSIKIFVCVILIALIYQMIFSVKKTEEELLSRMEKVGEVVLEIFTIVGLVYGGFSTGDASEVVFSSTGLGVEMKFNQIYFSFACAVLLGKASRRILSGMSSIRRCGTQKLETEEKSFIVEVSRAVEQSGGSVN